MAFHHHVHVFLLLQHGGQLFQGFLALRVHFGRARFEEQLLGERHVHLAVLELHLQIGAAEAEQGLAHAGLEVGHGLVLVGQGLGELGQAHFAGLQVVGEAVVGGLAFLQAHVERAQLGLAAGQVLGHLVVVGGLVGQLAVAVFEELVVAGAQVGVEATGFAVGRAGFGRVGEEALLGEAELGQLVGGLLQLGGGGAVLALHGRFAFGIGPLAGAEVVVFAGRHAAVEDRGGQQRKGQQGRGEGSFHNRERQNAQPSAGRSVRPRWPGKVAPTPPPGQQKRHRPWFSRYICPPPGGFSSAKIHPH